MFLGTTNLLPGVRQRLLIGLWVSFVVLNYQVVELVDIFANPVFKNPGILIASVDEEYQTKEVQRKERRTALFTSFVLSVVSFYIYIYVRWAKTTFVL